MNKFKDKVVIVTGSSMGIGKATAIELCKQGACVVLNGRNAERLEKTKNKLAEKGFNVIAVAGDVTNVEDCKNLINKTITAYGKIDVLITNAGISMREHFENIQPEVFKQIVDSNIIGSAYPTMHALPYIKKSKGSIVFISSVAGMNGMPTASAYSVGKMALTALSQSLRIELAHTGIHIGIVYVSFTKNDDEKMVLKADGTLVPVAARPSYLQQTQQEVAISILRSIERRKTKTVLSVIGKLNALSIRLFPRVVNMLIIYSQKRMKKMYE